jgi:mannose-6-phosphate isomerase-like protein (cupin superfamily)
MINKDDFIKALSNPDWYNQGLIYTISNGKDTCTKALYKTWVEFVDDIPRLVENKTTFKIQGFETYNKEIYNKCFSLSTVWMKPVDCHAYFSYEGQGSFDTHTDPCEVAIFVCEGTKVLTIDNDEVRLNKNDHVFIKANTPHKAYHETDCLSLSFGTYEYGNNEVKDLGIKL